VIIQPSVECRQPEGVYLSGFLFDTTHGGLIMILSLMPSDKATRKVPASRDGRIRPTFLRSDVLTRAVDDGESKLARRIEKMRGECQQ